MSALPHRLPDSDWFRSDTVRAIFRALDRDGDSVRIVGGAVRNALLDMPTGDIDFATTATPDLVVKRAEAAGFKVVPTGIEHGTVSLVREGRAFEVTTLRRDIETDGRRAVVAFGRDWAEDAARRDFTLNALYADAEGTIYDPVGGYADLVARHVRFIGDADRRIAEDRLRILRFFRFHAAYGAGPLDAAGFAASVRAKDALRELSAERIGQEMRRLAIAPRAAEAFTAMQDGGILPVVLGGVGYVARFANYAAFENLSGTPAEAAPRLAALGAMIAEDIVRLFVRLRLSNAERLRMEAALDASRQLMPLPDERAQRGLLYRVGRVAYADGVGLAAARAATGMRMAYLHALRLPERWEVPVFPLSGRDVLKGGAAHGPAVGALLRQVEAMWIAGDFGEDEVALRRRLQQRIAAQQ